MYRSLYDPTDTNRRGVNLRKRLSENYSVSSVSSVIDLKAKLTTEHTESTEDQILRRSFSDSLLRPGL